MWGAFAASVPSDRGDRDLFLRCPFLDVTEAAKPPHCHDLNVAVFRLNILMELLRAIWPPIDVTALVTMDLCSLLGLVGSDANDARVY